MAHGNRTELQYLLYIFVTVDFVYCFQVV